MYAGFPPRACAGVWYSHTPGAPPPPAAGGGGGGDDEDPARSTEVVVGGGGLAASDGSGGVAPVAAEPQDRLSKASGDTQATESTAPIAG